MYNYTHWSRTTSIYSFISRRALRLITQLRAAAEWPAIFGIKMNKHSHEVTVRSFERFDRKIEVSLQSGDDSYDLYYWKMEKCTENT